MSVSRKKSGFLKEEKGAGTILARLGTSEEAQNMENSSFIHKSEGLSDGWGAAGPYKR